MTLFHPTRLFSALIIVVLIYLYAQRLAWDLDWTEPFDSLRLSEADLITDAHRLATADDLLPHIRNVTELRGMTMAEAKSGCTWPNLDEVNFQYAKDEEWAARDRSDRELRRRRAQWHYFINYKLLPWEQYQNRFEGRGIVVLAGNENSSNRLKVMLRALRKLGSQMPVEVHYWGDELSEQVQEEILLLWPKTYFNDLSGSSNIMMSNNDNIFHLNYQLKTAAVLNSRFAEPLLLDSDNIPVLDPASLYESSTYQEYGTIFWPDVARTRPNNPMWAITNTVCRMDEYEQESGQLLVDKRRFFYHLQLAAWFINKQAPYYNRFLLGDKDMFRFTWHALKTKYGRPSTWVTSVGTLSGADDYYCGHTFAQHHPNGSVAFLHGGFLKMMAKPVMEWQRNARGGIFQAYKRSDNDTDPYATENVYMKFDTADYLPESKRPANLTLGGLCTEFGQVTPRPFEELVPGFEKTFEEIGGYWRLDDPSETI